VFCDNQGILDRINRLPVNRPLQPRPTTANDYNVYIAICTALHDLAPAIVQFRHVKGHQDQNSCQQLSLPARLNIECDKRAAEYLTIARCLKPKPNPRIPQCYPHLQINGQIIVRDLQSSLRDAATTPDYREYIRKKFKWKDRDCDNVNWLALKLAMRQFECNDRQRLQKFLHDWLPLRAALHMAQPASDRTCPVCQQSPEDFWHFLECQHPVRRPAYRQLQTALQQLHKDRGVDPHMLQLLWQGINSVHQQYQIDDQYVTYPASFQPLYLDQQRLGWEQLFYGRIASSWSYHVDHSTNYATNGTIFYSQIIVCIWKYILTSWTVCNEALHPEHPNAQTVQSLVPQVHHLFALIEADPELHQFEPRSTPEQILQWPIRTIRNFIQTGYRHVRNHTTAARTRAIHWTRDIRTYFCNLIHHDDHHPP